MKRDPFAVLFWYECQCVERFFMPRKCRHLLERKLQGLPVQWPKNPGLPRPFRWCYAYTQPDLLGWRPWRCKLPWGKALDGLGRRCHPWNELRLTKVGPASRARVNPIYRREVPHSYLVQLLWDLAQPEPFHRFFA